MNGLPHSIEQMTVQRQERTVQDSACDGTDIQALADPHEIFSLTLGTIQSAERYVYMQTCSCWTGDEGRQTVAALAEAARRGVCVRIITEDGSCSQWEDDQVDRMSRAGVHLLILPESDPQDSHRYPRKTHRKLLVVDDWIGLTGGVELACPSVEHKAKTNSEWHEYHYLLRGLIASELNCIFLHNWNANCADGQEVRNSLDGTQPCHSDGACALRITDRPETQRQSIYQLYREAFRLSQEHIRISTTCFVPNREIMDAIILAQLRGVQVEVMIPQHSLNSRLIQHASQALWEELLEAGVRLHRHRTGRLGARYMVVDDWWVMIGSAQFDNNTTLLKEELNLSVVAPDLAGQHVEFFKSDLRGCSPVDFETWTERPIGKRILEKGCRWIQKSL